MQTDKKPLEDGTTLRKQHKPPRKGNRRWLVLVALLAVAAVAVGVLLYVQHTPEQAENGAEDTVPVAQTGTLSDRNRGDLASVTVSPADLPEYTIVLDEAGMYSMQDAPDYPVDQAKAATLVNAVIHLAYRDVIDAPGALADYGLQTPQMQVRAAYTDGTEQTFLLGDRTPTGQQRYAMLPGDDNIYLIAETAASSMAYTKQALHTATMPQFFADAIEEITLVRPDGERITVGFQYGEETLGVSAVWLTEPLRYEADGEKTLALFDQIAAITMLSYEATATPETLSTYGLDSPRYTLSVRGRNANGDLIEALRLQIGQDKDAQSTYARIDGTYDIYRISRESIAFLSGVTTPRLIARFANIINVSKVDAIEIAYSGKQDTFAITREPLLDAENQPRYYSNGQPMYDESFTLNGDPLDEATFRKLYQILISTMADGMLPADWQPPENTPPALTITYHLNAVRDAERIEYLPYDTTHYAVRRNNETIFYILKSRADIIPQALEACHEGTFVAEEYGV